jgi:hypothetical protein
MRIIIALLLLLTIISSCNSGDKIPDVSNIKVDISTERFEKDLFVLDTTMAYAVKLSAVVDKYPSFGQSFLVHILGADTRWSTDSLGNYVKGFTGAYRNVFDTAMIVFKDFTPYEADIKKGLQFVKHYFPNYKLPKKIITYIGPLNGYGDILSDDALIVGLHLHLGSGFSMYQSELVLQTYPTYISNRFTPVYITVNCIKNIVLDMFPEKMEEKSLIHQMVEKGKRLYAMQKLLPKTLAHQLIGYTALQLKQAGENERAIWSMFAQNNLLQTVDENVIKNYIGESPKTQEMGDGSPGNIGSYIGWQIVKKYMAQNENISLQQLMTTDAETIFSGAKYKP